MRITSLLVSLCLIFCWSCNNEPAPLQKEEINYTADTKKSLSVLLKSASLQSTVDSALIQAYTDNDYLPFWMDNGKSTFLGDQLYQFIENSSYFGLFPNDYHYDSLKKMTTATADEWATKDYLLTHSLFAMAKDIHWGRIPLDTVNLRADTLAGTGFYLDILKHTQQRKNITQTMSELEPAYIGYRELKQALRQFLDSVGNIGNYEYLEYPVKDTLQFYDQLRKRLIQERVIHASVNTVTFDEWIPLITVYQYRNGLEANGKLSRKMIQLLNDTNWEKFIKVAITLDKMKQLPTVMPKSYLMVNIPSFEMKVYEEDTLSFRSRTIVGLPATRTPVLNSGLTNYITYPQWTVPYSIVFGEMIPKIIKDPGYLEKERLMVMDWSDNVVSPDSIDWKKANRSNFPYVIRQKEGDENSLGIMKFNFPNKFAVYLHDTNARWLFSRSDRALSHGCIRVQEFRKLASFLLKEQTKVKMDSVETWLAKQTKKVVSGFPRLPLYIRYYSCEGVEGKIRFYNDLYGDDKLLRNEYFSKKMSH
ncbi:L,D-transpeptidase family protein [Gynurincola endophyticus]|uniref:L,D-transpeptidase family protein n=1 Tax=Gynurincola endophyticus TaxID=2479004 RepID=UPI000F8F29B6|nr:L,D-transpeptidase family protein [Gynurincola endophyticus]